MTEIPPTSPEEIKKFLAEAAGASELHVRNTMAALHGEDPQDDQDPEVESLKKILDVKLSGHPEQEAELVDAIFGTREDPILADYKLTSEIPLTPEQMQQQQDEYDQMQAPTTELVDFEAERTAYWTRQLGAWNVTDGVSEVLEEKIKEGGIQFVSDLSEDEKRVIDKNLVQKVTGDPSLSEPTTEIQFTDNGEPPAPRTID
jgi:hypothetical protein